MTTKPKIPFSDTPITDEVIDRGGGSVELARRLGVSRQTVHRWGFRGRIPAERVEAVAEATGMGKDEIRPDLFDAYEHKGAHYLPRGKLPRDMIDELSRAEAAVTDADTPEAFRLKRAAAEIVPLLWELLG
jgi:DNA-binding transcriptional regulator YdaS (Cro superfamily)